MKTRSLILLLVFAGVAIFAALNWHAFLAPTPLSLGLVTVDAPLGLIMLGLLAFLSVLFLVYLVYIQTSVLFDARRQARELQANRELADQAEASRFTELRNFLNAELRKKESLDAETKAVLLGRMEQLEREMRAAIDQTGNALSAYIGELEDRLEKREGGPASHPPV